VYGYNDKYKFFDSSLISFDSYYNKRFKDFTLTIDNVLIEKNANIRKNVSVEFVIGNIETIDEMVGILNTMRDKMYRQLMNK
jgi:hypothetical protein